MNYYERVKNAVDYIEANLTNPIDLIEVAKTAGCSLFHFHRIFQATAGYSLKEYIRRRRLTEASLKLRNTKTGILEIALDFGYESQEAFTRAFQKETGSAPGEYRKTQSSFNLFPVLDIKFKNIIGVSNMINPKVVERKGFMVIGPAIHTTNENEENFQRLPKFWSEFNEKKIHEFIPNKISNNSFYGICMDAKGNEFTYMIGVEVNSLEQIPDNMVGRRIPEARYAVFTAKGPVVRSVQDMIRYIYGEWLPKSEYTLAETPDFELYDERFNQTDKCEVDI
jgi:AraC family transcriptional regulator